MCETPAQPCEWCGYDLTGLPVGNACPECGAESDDTVLREQAVAWHLGHGGLWGTRPPPRAFSPRLGETTCFRAALRRHLLFAIAPWIAVYATAWLISQFSIVGTFDRWWESASTPNARRDVDQISGRIRPLGEYQVPFLPSGADRSRADVSWHWRYASWSLIYEPGAVRHGMLGPATFVLVFSNLARLSAVAALALAIRPVFERRRDISRWRVAWIAASSFTIPTAAAALTQIVTLLLAAAEDAAFVPEYRDDRTPYLLLTGAFIGITVSVIWSAWVMAVFGAALGGYQERTRRATLGLVDWIAILILAHLLVITIVIALGSLSLCLFA